MTAGISMLIILLSILIRQRQYELFYVIHIVFAVVILMTGMNHDYLGSKLILIEHSDLPYLPAWHDLHADSWNHCTRSRSVPC